jgi:hypothetical protein
MDYQSKKGATMERERLSLDDLPILASPSIARFYLGNRQFKLELGSVRADRLYLGNSSSHPVGFIDGPRVYEGRPGAARQLGGLTSTHQIIRVQRSGAWKLIAQTRGQEVFLAAGGSQQRIGFVDSHDPTDALRAAAILLLLVR